MQRMIFGKAASRENWQQLFLSFLLPLALLVLRPLGLDGQQSAILASLVLVVSWWSLRLTARIFSSVFLIALFALLKAAPVERLLSFPQSSHFYLIALTYLFSHAIAKTGVLDPLVLPVLRRYAKTPVRVLVAIIAVFVATAYVIPQPLARLIIVVMLFKRFLDQSELPKATKDVLLFGAYVFYGMMNLAAKNADLIMNNAAVRFSGLAISDGEWIRYMALPSLAYAGLLLGLFIVVFRKELLGQKLEIKAQAKSSLDRKQVLSLLLIVGTVLLWATEAWHQIPAVWICLGAILLLFAMRVLHLSDIRVIDLGTLIFLTAAFSIGTAMRESGVAEALFAQISFLFQGGFSLGTVLSILLVTMLMHMLLGSNTTTMSIVIPGLLLLTSGQMPGELTVFASVLAVSVHGLLAFHSVPYMMGVAEGHIEGKHLLRLGLPHTLLIFLVGAFLYWPWWQWLAG